MKKEVIKKEETAIAVLDIDALLDVKRFDPLKKRITELVEKVGSTVSSTTAACPYEVLKENKKILAKERVDFTKMLKEERASAYAYQKGIVAVENGLLAIVEPLESKLQEKLKAADDAEIMEKRRFSLPERKEKLAAIGVEVEDDVILMMDGIQFSAFFNEKKELYLAEQERKLQEAQEKIEREKREAEEKKLRDEEIEKARAEAVEAEKIKQEEEKIKEAERHERELKEQREQMERERREEEQRRIEIIKEAERKKLEEERKKKEDEERIKKEKEEENLKMVRNEKFKEFLVQCGYNSKEFKIERNGDTIVCYKKVGEISL